MSKRKVTQIAEADGRLHALCQDGTVWHFEDKRWLVLPPIPQGIILGQGEDPPPPEDEEGETTLDVGARPPPDCGCAPGQCQEALTHTRVRGCKRR